MGIQFASIKNFKSKDWLDIENTLHEASLEIPNDSSLFSLVCSWVSVHGDYVIIEKLMKLQKKIILLGSSPSPSPSPFALLIWDFTSGSD